MKCLTINSNADGGIEAESMTFLFHFITNITKYNDRYVL